MIVRTTERPSAHLLTRSVRSPEKMHGTAGEVEVLQLTSSELRETFAVRLRETDCENPFELTAALARCEGEATAARIRNDRLVRVLNRRTDLLPCFVGYQDVPGVGLLPFMTDGVPGCWSLFFEEDGRMILAERRGECIELIGESDLLEPVPAEPGTLDKARSWLFAGAGAAARLVARRPQVSA